MFNPLIYAIAMSNILNEEFITPSADSTSFILLVLLLILLMVLAVKLDVFKFGLLSAGILVLYIAINSIMFVYYGIHMPVLNVLLPLIASTGYLMIHCVYDSQIKMGVLEGSLQSYLSPHLMEKLKNDPGDMMKPGGVRKRITVLFSDIAGFTSFTDQADPEEVQEVLEEYFSEMTSIVFEKNGIVDKYYGDGIMAFFENPEDGVTSAQTAVKSAVEMQKKAVELDK